MNYNKALKEYLRIRANSSYSSTKPKHLLKKFVAFLNAKRAPYITVKLALTIATQSKKCSSYECSRKLGMIRQFATYVKSLDSKTEIPPKDLLPYSYHRTSPYIYTKKEVIGLLNACKRLPTNCSLYPLTHYTLFGLIAVTGMRTGEAIALKREFVDLELGVITIYEGKFKKSRKISIHTSTMQVLRKYAKERDKIFKKPISLYFFVNCLGKGLTGTSVRQVFRRICIKTRLKKMGQSRAPRIMDLRHAFAVNTLIESYRKGQDVESVIPILSTYLGHANPINTYWYLTGTPDLLSLVNERVEKKIRGGQ